jgi:hypothetical protein
MIKIKDIAIIAFFASVLFLQEQLLTFLPNIQLTVFLIVLYSKVFKLWKTLVIVLIHTILDNIFMSSFSIYYFPFMLLGWSLIPIIINVFFKKVENPIILALVGLSCSFIYSWMFAIPQVIITKVDLIAYLVADLFFELILALTSFLTILWLYKPCSKLLYKLESNKPE